VSVGEYRYRISVDDLASDVIRRIYSETERLDRATRGAGRRVSEADIALRRMSEREREIRAATRDLTTAFGMLGGVVTNVSIMSFVLNLMWSRLEHTQERIRDLQERHTEALMKYGPASRQAQRLARDLEMAYADLGRAQRESTVQMVLFGMQAVALVPKILTLTRMLWGLRLAMLPIPGWAIAGLMLAGLGVYAGIVGGAFPAPTIAVRQPEGVQVSVEYERGYMGRRAAEVRYIGAGT